MNSSSTCEIYFIRHGETDWNFQDRIQGHTDIPLNATGISQALYLGQLLAHVPFSAAFSSDLSRARQTAELILKPRMLPITASLALRERSAGLLEGMNKDKFEEEIRPFLLSEQASHQETYIHTAWHPELETVHSVFTRVRDFLLPFTTYHPGQPILVVSHGGVLRSILDHLCFAPRKRWIVDNCGFIKIQINQQKIHLLDYHRVSNKQLL
ncbi:MAG: histidine phosphatase family protein [Gammaproteobacteria bacterium]